MLRRFNQSVLALIALVALLLATLNTNVATNVVSPSNDFSNLRPSLISFRTGRAHHRSGGYSDDAVEATA